VLNPDTAIEATNRGRHVRRKSFHCSTFVRPMLSEETSCLYTRQTDFSTNQILHCERFLCVYACHD
jgi:hypothetical protein